MQTLSRHAQRCVPTARGGVARVALAPTWRAHAHGAAASAEAPIPADPSIAAAEAALQGPVRMLAASLPTILNRYWAASPTACRAVDAVWGGPGGYGVDQLRHDHLAFRTFGVPGLGIESLGRALEAFGYRRQDDSVFPGKKLQATWYAPPPTTPGGPPAYDLLPRIFVSQLEVGKLSPAAQSIISRYTAALADFSPVATWAAVMSGALPWGAPCVDDYEALLGESEYAAWVLANGYSLNHTALSVHRVIPPPEGGLEGTNGRLAAAGFRLNDEGGAIKASPDGLLLQSSTVADVAPGGLVTADGKPSSRPVVRAYLEFVERRPLPEHSALPPEQLSEAHRRDGFEAQSADNIFASTTLAARAGGQ